MANQEHLDQLMQGVEVWNQCREEHTLEIAPDLEGFFLYNADLSRADLTSRPLPLGLPRSDEAVIPAISPVGNSTTTTRKPLNASSVIFKPAFNKGGVGELNPHPNVTMVDTTEAGVMRNVVARGGEVGTWGPCGCHLVRGKDPMRQPKIQADSSHPQKHSHHFVPSHE